MTFMSSSIPKPESFSEPCLGGWWEGRCGQIIVPNAWVMGIDARAAKFPTIHECAGQDHVSELQHAYADVCVYAQNIFNKRERRALPCV